MVLLFMARSLMMSRAVTISQAKILLRYCKNGAISVRKIFSNNKIISASCLSSMWTVKRCIICTDSSKDSLHCSYTATVAPAASMSTIQNSSQIAMVRWRSTIRHRPSMQWSMQTLKGYLKRSFTKQSIGSCWTLPICSSESRSRVTCTFHTSCGMYTDSHARS